jgi:hypothetical protein
MAVQQYLTEKTALEAQLINSQNEGNPVVSDEDDQLEEKTGGSGLIEEASSNLDKNGDSSGQAPAIEEGNEGHEAQQTPAEAEGGGEEEDRVNDEREGTTEQPNPEDLPQYFSELSVVGGLGCKAHLSLSRGEPVGDHTTVAIIVETLRYV